MPLVVITGYPSSGKTSVCRRIKEHLESERGCPVDVVSENDLAADRNAVYADSGKEKTLRGQLKSAVISKLSKDRVLILDGLNYIKGFRYELYCASKSAKTTQCTVHCDLSPSDAWEWNCQAETEGRRYDRATFDALVARYEAPSAHSRWDAPLLLSLKQNPLDPASVSAALFGRAAPPPNQSTQCQPLSSASFVYELDRITKEVVNSVLEAQRSGLALDRVKVPSTEERVRLPAGRRLDVASLTKMRRQFATYTKNRGRTGDEDVPKLAATFVRYLNSSLAEIDDEDQ